MSKSKQTNRQPPALPRRGRSLALIPLDFERSFIDGVIRTPSGSQAILLAYSFISSQGSKIPWRACAAIGDLFGWTIHTWSALGTVNTYSH